MVRLKSFYNLHNFLQPFYRKWIGEIRNALSYPYRLMNNIYNCRAAISIRFANKNLICYIELMNTWICGWSTGVYYNCFHNLKHNLIRFRLIFVHWWYLNSTLELQLQQWYKDINDINCIHISSFYSRVINVIINLFTSANFTCQFTSWNIILIKETRIHLKLNAFFLIYLH